MHTIKKLVVDFTLPSNIRESEGIAESNRLYAAYVKDALDRALSSFSEDVELILPTIDIDLGRIQCHDIPYELEKQLRDIISANIPTHSHAAQRSVSSVTIPKEEQVFNAYISYLANGYTDMYVLGKEMTLNELAESVFEMKDDYHWQLITTTLGRSVAACYRFVETASIEVLTAFIQETVAVKTGRNTLLNTIVFNSRESLELALIFVVFLDKEDVSLFFETVVNMYSQNHLRLEKLFETISTSMKEWSMVAMPAYAIKATLSRVTKCLIHSDDYDVPTLDFLSSKKESSTDTAERNKTASSQTTEEVTAERNKTTASSQTAEEVTAERNKTTASSQTVGKDENVGEHDESAEKLNVPDNATDEVVGGINAEQKGNEDKAKMQRPFHKEHKKTDDSQAVTHTPKAVEIIGFHEDVPNDEDRLIEDVIEEELSPYRVDSMANVTPKMNERIFVNDAGLVLLHPFFRMLFSRLELLSPDEDFISLEARMRAAKVLKLAASGQQIVNDANLVLEKVLCGIPFECHIDSKFQPTRKEVEEVENLLKSVTTYWDPFHGTSPKALREGFIMRNGSIEFEGESWTLHVEGKSIDLLMDTLPWGFEYIITKWSKPIIIDWQKEN